MGDCRNDDGFGATIPRAFGQTEDIPSGVFSYTTMFRQRLFVNSKQSSGDAVDPCALHPMWSRDPPHAASV